MIQDVFKAFITCFKAFKLMNQYRLWHYYLWVMIASFILFVLSIYLFFNLSNVVGEWVLEKTESYQMISTQSETIKNLLSKTSAFIFRMFIKVLGLYLFFKFSKYLYLILFSPFFAYISEKMEEKLFHIKTPFSVTKLAKDAIRGVVVSVRNLIIELMVSAMVLVAMFFFPILSLPLGLFSLFVGFYYFGYAVMDYNHERWNMSISNGSRRVRKYSGHAIGLGMFYYLASMLPIVGWLFSGINTTIAAVMLEQEKHPLLTQKTVENS